MVEPKYVIGGNVAYRPLVSACESGGRRHLSPAATVNLSACVVLSESHGSYVHVYSIKLLYYGGAEA